MLAQLIHHGHPASAILGILFVLLFFAIAIVVGWVLPITLGVNMARRKGYPAVWMLFGIHPLGGWIAYIVLASLPPRVQCPSCGGFVTNNFRICPYCRREMPAYAAYGWPGYPPGGYVYPPHYQPPPPPPPGPGPTDPNAPGGRA